MKINYHWRVKRTLPETETNGRTGEKMRRVKSAN
jgi:hypothetical protein